MRRTLAASAVALSLALAAMPAVASATAGHDMAPDRRAAAQDTPPTAHQRATAALEHAKALFDRITVGNRMSGKSAHSHGDATMVLRDLFARVDDLSPNQLLEARAILARPTDGGRDPYGDGYKARSVKQCSTHFCVHWVKRTKDRAPSRAWALKMLRLMNRVWKKEVGQLGYRRPPSDNGRGGNNKFDVYLAQLADDGLYGYCAPERTVAGFRYLANGYCVLDNDYAFSEYGAPPMSSAKATAAHEFFHAIQFGYDYLEDVWLMESTATWMEERVFDDVNDNRQYFPESQLVEPRVPLDYYNTDEFQVYGNWVFFEFLTKSFGKGVVRQIWNKAAAFARAPDMYSTQAIVKVLSSRGGFTKNYARFVGANLLPSKFYPEGSSWPSAGLAAGSPITLTSSSRDTGEQGFPLLHMSSLSWLVNSSPTLTGSQFHLKVDIDGPASFKMPAGYVQVVKHDGSVTRHYVKLDSNGKGQVVVPFDYTSVAGVYVSLVNASTRFACYRSSTYSCNGLPIDDGVNVAGQQYRFTASVVEVS